MSGFFPTSTLLTKIRPPSLARCGSCKLHKGCRTPKMLPTGDGKLKVLFTAEAPGKEEDRRGIQLIGNAGQRLRRTLRNLKPKVKLDRDCWKTNAIICRPPKNRKPTDDEIEACRPYLIKAVEKYQPNVIIPLGLSAVKSLIGWIWKEDVGTMGRWVGWQIPCQALNAWICPTYHPSYLLRQKDALLSRIFRKHIKAAFAKAKNKPWKTVPSYEDRIEVITRPAKAAKAIRAIKSKAAIAFDYEANCLKPEVEGSEIISCSVCWSEKHAIAFPWRAEAIDAMIELLKSPVGKIASNIKFEDRWTRCHLGFNIREWYWDTMLAAHIIDNRPLITGLKFQSFVSLGMVSYNDHIEPLLKPIGKSPLNRIHEIDLQDLLVYNGLDSLLEFMIAKQQMRIMKRIKGR